MSHMDLLLWVRGPVLGIAGAIFLFGMILRLFEIYSLGRKKDLAPARTHSPGSGWRTVWSRSIPHGPQFKRSPLTLTAGYLFHIGFFVVLLFLLPHIKLFQSVFGIHWPALPTPVIDLVAVISIIALLISLIHRLLDPVRRFLSRFGDYLAWTITILPLLTGYMAYHHLLIDYTLMLSIHILSVELLLVLFPFTKLTHMMSLFISRWYNGDWFARKGVAS
jgi:nitrate reductase gamma subunit